MKVNKRAPMHKRSNSDPLKFKKVFIDTFQASPRLKLDMREEKSYDGTKKRQSSKSKVQHSLKQEIILLQRRLKDQFMVRRVLEKASGCTTISHDANATNEFPMLQSARDLIKEIAVLELQVVYLEKHLLSMYRKRFNQVSSLSTMYETDQRLQSTSLRCKEMFPDVSGHDTIPKKYYDVMKTRDSIDNPEIERDGICVGEQQKLKDSSILRSHTSLSQRLIRTPQIAEAVNSYHSLPLSMLEHDYDATPKSLAEHLDTYNTSQHISETPNWLSEEMIKCISSIYCKLADPRLMNHDYCSSPVSFCPSELDFTWSPECKKYASMSSDSGGNPFNSEEKSKEFSGLYSTMLEVQWVCRDSKKLRETEPMLQSFRSLVCRLEEIDPRKMKHEEKLAFWINVHNALVMHAYLVYGIPQNNLKRMSLVLKAAYNVGGQTISVDTIQRSILACRLPRPGQWLRFLFSLKTKFKVEDSRRSYAIKHPESLLHFALCSGSHSDPAVRVYTPERVFLELQAAKEEYIEMNLQVHKANKILLPKIVESFAKDSDICPAGLVKMIEHLMPESLRKRAKQSQHGRLWKSIEWVPHNFAFRYLLSRDLRAN